MNPTRLVQLFCCVVVVGILTVGSTGCKSDSSTNPPPEPTGFSSSSTSLTASPGGSANATLSGGTPPYSIETGPDDTIATATLSGSTLTVNALISGYTSLKVKDSVNASIRIGISVTGPITYTLFPLHNNDVFIYSGYAINASSNGSGRIPDPNNVYQTRWTILGPNPGPFPPAGSFVILDVTTLHLTVDTTVGPRTLVIIPNPVTGSFTFLQTLGPFFRATGVLPLGRQDTVRAVKIADPSVGIGGTWTAFDSTYPGANGDVRLQIVGALEGGESITDSTSQKTTHDALRFKTIRNVFVNGIQVVSNAVTSRLWLVKNLGPVQVHIAEDTENIGHFRVLKQAP